MVIQGDQQRIRAMRVGGQRLGRIKQQLQEYAQVGMSFAQIETKAQQLISQSGCVPSFSTVPGYDWATCIMANQALCHGIPADQRISDGDLITIDVGLIYQGYHLDTTTSFLVGRRESEKLEFLKIGSAALQKAIDRVRAGVSVYEVSRAMQKQVETHGCGAVYQLTGHGIGAQLHQDPAIPCVAAKPDKHVLLHEGLTVAIEIMYTQGDPELVVAADGWTYETKDGSLSAMFEETVLVTQTGSEILTAAL